MKQKGIFFLLCTLLIIPLLLSCQKKNNTSIPDPISSTEFTEVTQSIDRDSFFAVFQKDFLYYYEVYDKNGNVIASDGPMAKYPDIVIVEDVLIRIITQGGTGKGTQTGYFCNVETGEISELFNNVFDQYNGLVVYAQESKIIVTNIFGGSFYWEITDFQYPFSSVAFPFENAEFINDGAGVRITYLSGSDYEQISEEFTFGTDGLKPLKKWVF